jgi:hypothetical protein
MQMMGVFSMSLRHVSIAALLVLCACSQEEEVACCAIEPKAKCEGALHGLGVSEEEQSILLGPRPVCPGPSLSAERINELDAKWPAACRDAHMPPPLIEAARC